MKVKIKKEQSQKNKKTYRNHTLQQKGINTQADTVVINFELFINWTREEQRILTIRFEN